MSSKAQNSPITKFGKIDPLTFAAKAYSVDSSAGAVILFDHGRTEIEGNQKGWFSMRHTHRRRVHILKKDGYDHAKEMVALYKDNDGETSLQNLKCATYNLEDGKVVETKLEKSQVFEEQVDKNRKRVRFTAPAVKEGSIVEYEYTILSDFYFSLMPWEFQGSIPRLWSEYQFAVPQFMDYLFFAQGYVPFHIKEKKDRVDFFSVTSNGIDSKRQSFSAGVSEYRWVMKEVGVLKDENFTSTLENHIAKIEFQLSGYREPLSHQSILNDWPTVSKNLMERDDFGKLVNANNGWLDDILKPILDGTTSQQEQAQKIFAYVRDHFTCTDRRALFAEQSLRNVVKTGKGNVCELNLLLVTLMRHAGLEANPVILSTRDNGLANVVYPQLSKYNYVVAKARLGEKETLLDATLPHLSFGRMPSYCYNGAARQLDGLGTALELSPDSLLERKLTYVALNNVGGKWVGMLQQAPGYYQSLNIRETISDKGRKAFEKELQTDFESVATINKITIDSLDNKDAVLLYKCEFDLKMNGEDILYVNPLFSDRYFENPFKAASRSYPVEMPYAFEKTYTANITVPEGYVLDEMPKQIRMAMNEDRDATLDYLISYSNNVVSMQMVLKIKRTWFSPDEYDMLREFFKHVVAKQSEQLVFKKAAK
ncbi:hypothetical protein BUE76_14435 [Cnuella takakiae]|nr:hypothetical protein BUE76_14435 [Cnuella takakiae]